MVDIETGGRVPIDGSGGSLPGGPDATGGSGGSLPQPRDGALRIEIDGLPSGADANVNVAGPEGFVSAVVATEHLGELLAGAYTVNAGVVAARHSSWLPSAASLKVEVVDGTTAVVRITYTEGELGLYADEAVTLPIGQHANLEVTVLRSSRLSDNVTIRVAGDLPTGIKAGPLVLAGSMTTGLFTFTHDTERPGQEFDKPHPIMLLAESGGITADAPIEITIAPVVTTTADTGPGSLREVLALATRLTDAPKVHFDRVAFSSPQVILLRSQIELRSDVELEGPVESSEPLVTVRANGSRIFFSQAGHVRLAGLRLEDGESDTEGGCIANEGNLELDGVHLSRCKAWLGGAISSGDAPSARLRILRSRIEGSNAASEGGAVHVAGDLHVEDSVIASNTAGRHGGGLFIADTVTQAIIEDSFVIENIAQAGGGIYSQSPDLQLIRTEVRGNEASGDGPSGDGGIGEGGGIHAEGKVTLLESEVKDNRAIANDELNRHTWGSGGGIFGGDSSEVLLRHSRIQSNESISGGGIFSKGRLHVDRSTIDSNVALLAGGGISSHGPDSFLQMDQSTLSRNFADMWGGGLELMNVVVFIRNSTIAENETPGPGGAIILWWSALSVAHSTIAGNTARGVGGIYAVQDSEVYLQATILAGNLASEQHPDGLSHAEYHGYITSNGQNLIGVGTGTGIASMPTDLIGTLANPLDPMLLPLQNNGGPTETMDLGASSPARNKISAAACTFLDEPVQEDQRGSARPAFGACDIGAVEADWSR